MCWIYFLRHRLSLGAERDRKANAAYVLFMRKYYHLHEEYLASLKK